VFRDQLHCLSIEETITKNHQPVGTQVHPQPQKPRLDTTYSLRERLLLSDEPHSNSKRGLRSEVRLQYST
jgi:hypothetical protein